jgi:hypothetical protein
MTLAFDVLVQKLVIPLQGKTFKDYTKFPPLALAMPRVSKFLTKALLI